MEIVKSCGWQYGHPKTSSAQNKDIETLDQGTGMSCKGGIRLMAVQRNAWIAMRGMRQCGWFAYNCGRESWFGRATDSRLSTLKRHFGTQSLVHKVLGTWLSDILPDEIGDLGSSFQLLATITIQSHWEMNVT